ncbi:MAG: DegT/DnrJ/EryC1/StrS family aminotransferase [Luteimonas sp.]
MRELPPTAGMSIHWRDLFPGNVALVDCMEPLLGIDELQITCSGTAALVIALTTLAADSDREEVVIPAYTCPLVALAVSQCGLKVRLCDSKPDALEMDPVVLEPLCSSRTLAVVPTYLCGRVHDIQPVLDCAARVGAAVIEDGAQALGARHMDGTPVGMRGDIGLYSLAVGKGLTMYEGGVLMSRHPHLRAALRGTSETITPRKPAWELRRCIELLGYALFYRPLFLPLVYGMPLRRALRRHDMQGAAGDQVPAKIPLHRPGEWRQSVVARTAARWLHYRDLTARQAQRRSARLRDIAGIQLIKDAPGAQGVWPVLAVLMPDAATREKVLSRLWHIGVGIGVPFAFVLADYQLLDGIMPADAVANARGLATRVLTITNSHWLDDATFDRIAGCIEAVIRPATHPASAG